MFCADINRRLPELLSGESVPIFGDRPAASPYLVLVKTRQRESGKVKDFGTEKDRGKETEWEGHASWQNRIGHTGSTGGAFLTREGSSGSGVRGEPSGVEGQLWSLALVTSPSARASNEGKPSSSTGILSRVSVSTASKLASFSSSIFLRGWKEKGKEKEQWKKRDILVWRSRFCFQTELSSAL